MSVYVWTEKAARIVRDASLAGKPATICGHTVKSGDVLAQAWIDRGYVEQVEHGNPRGRRQRKRKEVVVIDIRSGAIVKRYATIGDAAAMNLCGRDIVRDYCNHQRDESDMRRTFRWAEEADGQEGID